MNVSGSPLSSKPILRVSAGLLVAIGAGLSLLAIFADALNIGGGDGFGYQQLIGVILGIGLMLLGLAIAFQKYLVSNQHDSFEPER